MDSTFARDFLLAVGLVLAVGVALIAGLVWAAVKAVRAWRARR